MNIHEYISSGIVESYVLGLSDREEAAEFERMCREHPEVKTARDLFELQLEKQAFVNVVAPPERVRKGFFAELDQAAAQDSSAVSSPVVPMSAPGHQRTTGNWARYLAAASIILLIASTALNFYFFQQYKSYSTRYNDLLAQNQLLTSNSNTIQTRLRSYESTISRLTDTNVTVVKMPGFPKGPSPASLATVYWDKRTKEVYIYVNNMPRAVPNKQYQLWALVGGKPVDAGTFDVNGDTVLLRMKNVLNAETFAVTLEKQGGSPTPDLTQLYVIGNVKT
ncbi:MAG: anti-sigma factor [Williamsia sp.]|nr:anti-sigma factor [Williamsia sp.]